MANRLVSVDDNFDFPPAVGKRLSENLMAGVDVRTYGAIDGAPNNTESIRAAAAAAAGGLLIIPPGVWITDPVSLESDTTVHLYGTLRLRGQDAANLPSNCGVLYSYGTTTARKSRVKIHGFGGKIDGNRRGMSNKAALTYDQEGINFKYHDHGEIVGVEVFDAIESGVDLDTSVGNVIRNVYSHDNAGNGFHLSNGAMDNLIEGCTAENNGHGNDRNGFDQYAGSSPQANRNRYIGNRSINNNRNYKIEGQQAVFEGNTSIDGTKPNVITANLTGLSPIPAPVRMPTGGAVKLPDPTGGTTVDVEARETLNAVLGLLSQMGLRNEPVVVASDTFSRPDGTLGIADSGQTWLDWASLFQINGQKAAVTAGAAGTGSTYLSTGAADVRITATQTLSTVRARAGIAFRQTPDAQILILEFAKTGSTSQLSLRKRANGASTDLQMATGFAPVLGRAYAVRIEAVGNVITVWVDGQQVIAHTLSQEDAATFGGMNRHGLYANAGVNSDDGGTRWDDFKVTQLAV